MSLISMENLRFFVRARFLQISHQSISAPSRLVHPPAWYKFGLAEDKGTSLRHEGCTLLKIKVWYRTLSVRAPLD